MNLDHPNQVDSPDNLNLVNNLKKSYTNYYRVGFLRFAFPFKIKHIFFKWKLNKKCVNQNLKSINISNRLSSSLIN